jgi:hydrogenase nickel incorporation protein HypA/HybF
MHEHALIRDVMARIGEVARAEGATRVTAVRVRIGALAHVTPEHFREHFEDAARGTVAEGATVHAEVVGEATSATARDVVVETVEVELADPGSAGDAA